MTLGLNIDRSTEAAGAQVSCTLDGELTGEFYGFSLDFTDEAIEAAIREDLTAKGYEI